MIDVSEKNYENLLNYMLDLTPDTLNKREGSLIRTSLAAAAWTIEGLYINLQYVQKQAYGHTATGEYLDYIAATAGLARKQATKAVYLAAFNMELPIGTQFVIQNDDNTTTYFTLLDIEEVDTDDWQGHVRCEEAGYDGNLYSGDLLLVSFVTGLTKAELVSVSEYGENVESDSSLRLRYLEAIGRVSFGGNIQAYRNYMLAQDGVGEVQVWPAAPTAGFVKISVITPEYSAVSPERLQELQNLVCPPEPEGTDPSANGYGMAPIGASVTVTTPTVLPLAITISLTLKPGNTRTLAEIKESAFELITDYLHTTLADWGQMILWNYAAYNLTIYATKIIALIDGVDGVKVVNSVTLYADGQTSTTSLDFPQSATTQTIPSFAKTDLIITTT